MMTKGLKLPVFYEFDTPIDPENPLPLTEYEVKNIIFYHIDAVTIYEDKDDGHRPYGQILTSGGERFIINLTPQQLEDRIEKHLKSLIAFSNQ